MKLHVCFLLYERKSVIPLLIHHLTNSLTHMITIDNELLDSLFEQAKASERKRMNFDLRTSAEDGSQRMLNALLPGTVVPIHLRIPAIPVHRFR